MFEQVQASESFGYTVKTPLSSWVTSRRWITIFLLPPNMSSEWEKFTHMSRQLFKKQKKGTLLNMDAKMTNLNKD